MRTRHTMTVSLPRAMVREIEIIRKAEHRTRSELVREALRTYFNVRSSYTPSPSELRAIERGRAALRRGEYVSVDDLRAALGTPSKQARGKKDPTRATA